MHQICYNAFDSCFAGWAWIPLLLPPFAYIPLTASTLSSQEAPAL